jgi:hypothetical protein
MMMAQASTWSVGKLVRLIEEIIRPRPEGKWRNRAESIADVGEGEIGGVQRPVGPPSWIAALRHRYPAAMDADEKPWLPDLVPSGLAGAGQYAISSTPAFRSGEKVAKPEYWLRLRPWSLTALSVAVASLAAAVAIRMVLAEFGMQFYFATFIPAILATALLAGVPAAAFTTVSAAIIVWWACIPPVFEFSPLTRGEIHAFTLFLLSTAMLIWFGQLCRTAARMRKQKAA